MSNATQTGGRNRRAFAQKYLNPVSLAVMAVLLAAEVILSRFLSFSTMEVKIGFAFVPVAIAARVLGPGRAAAVAALGDFLGALLFPVGPYFPGFTLTAGLRGLCTGFFLHKRANLARISAATVVNEAVGSLLLNTLWISMLYGTPFLVLLATRLGQAAVMTVVQIVCLWLLLSKGDVLFRGLMNREGLRP